MDIVDHPYLPPRDPQVAAPATGPTQPPRRLKWFGGLHLAAGLLGIATSGLMIINALDAETKSDRPSPGLDKVLIPAGIDLLVCVLAIIAGAKLLRGKPECIAWSNGYAVTSVLLKVAMVGFALWISSTLALSPELKQVAHKVVIVALIIPLSTAIYPLLSLIFLNQKPVREWAKEAKRQA